MPLSQLFKKVATTACLALRQKRNTLLSSAAQAPINTQPSMQAMQTTRAIPGTPITPHILFTEAPIDKLCDTLWMEINVIGYKGATRAELLKGRRGKKEKDCTRDEEGEESEEKNQIPEGMRDILRKMDGETCMPFQFMNQGISTGR